MLFSSHHVSGKAVDCGLTSLELCKPLEGSQLEILLYPERVFVVLRNNPNGDIKSTSPNSINDPLE